MVWDALMLNDALLVAAEDWEKLCSTSGVETVEYYLDPFGRQGRPVVQV